MKACFVICLLIFLSNLLLADSKESKCHLKVGYDEAKPFHYLNKEGNVVGSDAEILELALKQANCTIEFIELPWARTLKYVKSGKVDIAIGASYKDERAIWAHYSVPYKAITHWIYTKSDGKYIVFSLEDLFEKKMKLGVVIGWNYTHEIRRILDEEKNKEYVLEFDAFHQLPKVLNKNRVDAIIAIPKQLRSERDKDNTLDMFVPRVQYKEQLHFLFSKESVSPEVVVKFNNALYNLIYNGTTNKILNKY